MGGSAISGAIWSGNVLDKLKLYLPEETKARAEDIYGNIGLAANGWPMGDPTREAINRAYQETMTMILMVAVCVAIPCIFLSLLMKDYKLDEIDQHVKGVVVGSAQDNTDHHAEAGPSNSASTHLLARPSHDFDEETNLDFSSQGRRAASLLGKQKSIACLRILCITAYIHRLRRRRESDSSIRKYQVPQRRSLSGCAELWYHDITKK